MNAYVDPTSLRYDAPVSAGYAPARYTPGRRRSGGVVIATLRWLAEMPRRHAVLAELQALSDRELSDIGLTRGDLPGLFSRPLVSRRGA